MHILYKQLVQIDMSISNVLVDGTSVEISFTRREPSACQLTFIRILNIYSNQISSTKMCDHPRLVAHSACGCDCILLTLLLKTSF